MPICADGGKDTGSLVPGDTDIPPGTGVDGGAMFAGGCRYCRAQEDRTWSTPRHRVQKVDPCPRSCPRTVAACNPGRRVFHGGVLSAVHEMPGRNPSSLALYGEAPPG